MAHVSTLIGHPYREFWALANLDVKLYFENYARYARRGTEAGGLPVLLSQDTDPELVSQGLNGIVLPGRTDVDLALYGAEAAPEVQAIPPVCLLSRAADWLWRGTA